METSLKLLLKLLSLSVFTAPIYFMFKGSDIILHVLVAFSFLGFLLCNMWIGRNNKDIKNCLDMAKKQNKMVEKIFGLMEARGKR